jgi:hypothetical protein
MSMGDGHPMLGFLAEAAAGRFPVVDGGVTVLPGLPRGLTAVLAFTGHAVIATHHDPAETAEQAGPEAGFGGALQPAFLLWLAAGGVVGTTDITLVARGTGAGTAIGERSDLEDHYRVRHARRLRESVKVYGDERGLITLGEGLAGRRELSVEAWPDGQGRGWGRSLVADALAIVAEGEAVFAAVSPGNARSVRAFLGLGFVPLGSETIIGPYA